MKECAERNGLASITIPVAYQMDTLPTELPCSVTKWLKQLIPSTIPIKDIVYKLTLTIIFKALFNILTYEDKDKIRLVGNS